MQSELLSHINGLFSGKNRRKSGNVIPTDDNSDSHDGSNFLLDKLRRKSETTIGNGSKSSKQDGGGKQGGISLVRVAKLDFKLNLKRISFTDDIPPALPVRHFSTDDDEDLPPPIPERKCSLDFVVDEEFQGRFAFRPISTVPLPEEFTDCKKNYPSNLSKKPALQRPPSQPPPPPPPADFSPSPTSGKTFELPSSATTTSQKNFEDDDPFLPPPPPPAVLIHGSPLPKKMNGDSAPMQSQPTLDKNHNFEDEFERELPPPPSRPLPPPPQSSKKPLIKLSSFNPNAPVCAVDPVSPSSSPKMKKSSNQALQSSQYAMTNRLQPPSISVAKPESTLSKAQPLPPSPLPNSPPPPPLPARPATIINAAQIPPTVPPHSSKPRDHPTLPVKPFQNRANVPPSSLSLRKLSATPDTNGAVLNGADESASLPPPPPLELQPPPPLRPHSPLPPLPPLTSSSFSSRSTSPLPPPPPPAISPLHSPSLHNPNRHRPLPSPPSDSTNDLLAPPPIMKGVVGGQEIFDPREEDGDLYDIMDSTNM